MAIRHLSVNKQTNKHFEDALHSGQGPKYRSHNLLPPRAVHDQEAGSEIVKTGSRQNPNGAVTMAPQCLLLNLHSGFPSSDPASF